jgi:hypothetical protein
MKIFNTEVKVKVITDKSLNKLDLAKMAPEKFAKGNELARRIKLPDTSSKSKNRQNS